MKKKKTYNHLNIDERDLLAVLKGKGLGIRDIARNLDRAPSSISRELKRNAPPIRKSYYLPHRAHQRYVLRNQQRAQRLRLKTQKIRSYATRHLKIGWSPELISGRLTHLWPQQTISPEAIYQLRIPTKAPTQSNPKRPPNPIESAHSEGRRNGLL